MSFPSSRELESLDIPKDAFVGPVQLDGTVILETAINNPLVVHYSDLFSAWQMLSAVSVEAALVDRPDMFDFADNHCLLFAAVRSPIKVDLPEFASIADLELPDDATIACSDSPILPKDPSAIYDTVHAYHEEALSTRDTAFTPDMTPSKSPSSLSSSGSSSFESTPVQRQNNKAIFQWKTIGVVYVTMSATPGEVHIGIAILPAYRTTGRGMIACAFAVQCAVESIQAHRVQARIMASPHRERAQRLFTALGFAHEGIQRRAVQDSAGAWTDVTHMGTVDLDWVMRRRVRAAPRNMWDELFERHQREREELLRWEERQDRMRMKRTSSMETVRMVTDRELEMSPEPPSSESGPETRSPSPTRSAQSSVSHESSLASVFTQLSAEPAMEEPWRSPRSVAGTNDADSDPFSDTEWVLGDARSDAFSSSEEPLSRPHSAASFSSFESVQSVMTSSSDVETRVEEWVQRMAG